MRQVMNIELKLKNKIKEVLSKLGLDISLDDIII